jgi:hypothetical protein
VGNKRANSIADLFLWLGSEKLRLSQKDFTLGDLSLKAEDLMPTSLLRLKWENSKYDGKCDIKKFCDKLGREFSGEVVTFGRGDPAVLWLPYEWFEWFNASKKLLEGSKLTYNTSKKLLEGVDFHSIDSYIIEHSHKSMKEPSTKMVEKKETQTLYRPVPKEVSVTKYKQNPIYKNVTNIKFDAQKYNSDIAKLDNEIRSYRDLISKDINKFPKGKLSKFEKETIISEHFKDLLELWQIAEYEAYFTQNPHNSLDNNDIIGQLKHLSEEA